MEVKRAKVHMLPTELNGVIAKGSRLYYIGGRSRWQEKEPDGSWTHQHLYFTTDEEIKEGDWCLKPIYKGGIKIGYGILQADSSYFGGYGYDWEDHHKIIATTDPKLKITDLRISPTRNFVDMPKPSQAFIKKYCKVGGIDEVDVEYELKDGIYEGVVTDKETWGELKNSLLTLKVDPIHNTITTHRIVEKTYSKDDVIKAIKWADDARCEIDRVAIGMSNENVDNLVELLSNPSKWIEENL